jgi:hypothetical protein
VVVLVALVVVSCAVVFIPAEGEIRLIMRPEGQIDKQTESKKELVFFVRISPWAESTTEVVKQGRKMCDIDAVVVGF